MNPLVERLTNWLSIDSTSGSEAAFLETLQSHFEAQGYRCTRDRVAENRWNLTCLTDAQPRVVYSTHVDTVPPFIGPKVEDGVIYGRGACDTKGGIVAMDAAAARLRADGLHEVGFLLVVGEEVDHCGAKHAGKQAFPGAERIILCEPTRNRVVSAQKGMVKLVARATGIAGHSAYPDRGESAVHKLLDAIERWRAEPWPEHDILGPTTLNVGVIEGGVAANVFAPDAHAQVLVRAVSPVEPLIDRMRELAGDDVAIDVPAANDPVFFDPPADVETSIAAFNTDATYLQTLAPIWLVGPGDIEVAHSVNEHITIADLEAGVDLYERLGRLVLTGDNS
jgi:acetylornithine deacetylase